MQRYYFGEKMLNTLNGKKPIARMVSTLPGPHILMYLDRQSFDDYRSRFRRRNEQPEMNRYPSRDAGDPDQLEADPYDASMFKRYPSWMVIKNIIQARKLRKTMISSLPKAVLDRIFHIRSQSEKTWIEQFWQPIDGSKFNPDKKSPLSGDNGPGDGTVPFWSARLAQTPSGQVYNIKNKVEHQELLEHSEVLQAILRIHDTGTIPAPLGTYRTRLGEPKARPRQPSTMPGPLIKNIGAELCRRPAYVNQLFKVAAIYFYPDYFNLPQLRSIPKGLSKGCISAVHGAGTGCRKPPDPGSGAGCQT
jgi:hypothetical protein